MPELTTTERLQPSLLDRLIDEQPDQKLESREKRVMSMRALRTAVLRDLAWLLNTPSRPIDDEVHKFPLVAKSVLNFGLPDLTGLTVSGIRAGRLENMVTEAIANFEPRIIRSTLVVRAAASEKSRAGNRAQFEISGDLCPLPMPEALFVRTEVDFETGHCEVKEGA
jgi:type VI secretion system protein ImpF